MHLPLYTPPGEEDGKEHGMTNQGPGRADVLKSLFNSNNDHDILHPTCTTITRELGVKHLL